MKHFDIHSPTYESKVYAGILGKLIGVYLGRPVEGWPYASIRAQFGQLDTYVNKLIGIPLIVADDDISGTLTFARVVEDAKVPTGIRPADVGDTWLNYIIEDRTILWWGGYGRSTEHTAFLNLKNGVGAPQSGSVRRNGKTLAEQIGAQIFSDAYALMCPGDPERAVALTKAASSVSHDGVALDCAAFFAAMRASAFGESDLDTLIDGAAPFVRDSRLSILIDDVNTNTGPASDWREVREWVDRKYGYARYPGPCHSLSNTAMSLAALRVGGDSFRKAVMIAASVGFDTDSNAGTIGCLNAVRLGIEAIRDVPDLREPVADRAIVVSADGGESITDAALEAYRIVRSARRLQGVGTGPRIPRFDFRMPGAVHGFTVCPHLEGGSGAWARNLNSEDQVNALTLHVPATGNGVASFSTPTFLDPLDEMTNFSTVASPSLYPTDQVTARISASTSASVRLFALYSDHEGLQTQHSGFFEVGTAGSVVEWEIPACGNLVPFRLGIEVSPAGGEPADIRIHEIDWRGAPRQFEQRGVLLNSIWDTKPSGLAPWVSSAKNFEADFASTYSVSHPETLGVVTTGTREWIDYEVRSNLKYSLHHSGGLVLRARGHRRFIAALFTGSRRLQIIRQLDETRQVLAETDFGYVLDETYDVAFRCVGDQLSVTVNGATELEARTDCRHGGGAGFLVERGTLTADGFSVRAL
ncbi:ADP-ribosylglycohydrolase family protein [Arthrobacter sp. efr-133-R2A-120]|uniref:ADP-ribosylglycohydrolase family protein n=1 Tax=Arthrobacter sp. efr-133-R2A-120 TaxID=3040277 RepID=UPI00254F950D|nr:ADP-ribosylglycohydrolase family protein [Arthrobacter sp. efr-133-R2A-120]